MPEAPSPWLVKKIALAEGQMRAALEEARAGHRHAGAKGTVAESAFRLFLTRHLPRSLSVGQGEIVDKKGNRSGQTDVVVTDFDHPLTFRPDEPGLFFVEGVVGAGEVKSILTGGELTKTLKASVRFKTLEPDQPRPWYAAFAIASK